MFEQLATVAEQYLAGKIPLAELRAVRHELAGPIVLARPAERDQAAFDFEDKLFALLTVLDMGEIDTGRFNAELRDALLRARALAA